MSKIRADQLLVRLNEAPDTDRAARLIMAGSVFTDKQERVQTPGEQFSEQDILYVKQKETIYVSRGGEKLAHALELFQIELAGETVLDIGSSTGGFTDVALRHGAQRVYALDVGTNQLAWKLRQDPRVTVMEQTNFRYSRPEDFKEGEPTFACTDVSFISLTHILEPLADILPKGRAVVTLIKPQFEAAKEDVGPGGIVSDPVVYEEVLRSVCQTAASMDFALQQLGQSPITGTKGNREFLGYFIKGAPTASADKLDCELDRVLNEL